MTTETWSTRPCPVRPLNDGCLAPMPGHWLALTAEGFVRITDDDQWLVGPVELPEETSEELHDFPDGRPRRGLHTSRDGRFAAVVSDYGQFATVVDLDEWLTVLDLDRQRNDNEFTRFPLAFLGEGETAKVVAGTDWNRLDVFTLPGGELLTDRETAPPQERGQPYPEHYLDYCQGALHPSPSERWLVTDGWAWHPVGIPLAIDLTAWLGGDRHAAEHARHLADRDDTWDTPIAWTDENTVALQDANGVELWDAGTGRRTGMFAGPTGRMWGHGGLLYVAAEAGLEVWDPAEGARIGFLEGFTPIAHREGTFAELRNDQLRTWTTAR